MNRVLMLAATLAAVAGVSTAGTAVAAPGPTPNGYVGALNMLQDPTMFSVAMAHAADQGNTGMFRAVCVSAGFC